MLGDDVGSGPQKDVEHLLMGGRAAGDGEVMGTYNEEPDRSLTKAITRFDEERHLSALDV